MPFSLPCTFRTLTPLQSIFFSRSLPSPPTTRHSNSRISISLFLDTSYPGRDHHCSDGLGKSSAHITRLVCLFALATRFQRAMTRRLTIGSRSEMGLETNLLSEPASQPDPSFAWSSPTKLDFWKKPSKWQICMPRLRLVLKFVLSFVCLVLLLKVLNDKPPPKKPAKPPTEDEAREAEKRTNWLWKDFPMYDTTYLPYRASC